MLFSSPSVSSSSVQNSLIQAANSPSNQALLRIDTSSITAQVLTTTKFPTSTITPSTSPSTTSPTTTIFETQISLKMKLGLAFNSSLNDPNSNYYKKLKEDLTNFTKLAISNVIFLFFLHFII